MTRQCPICKSKEYKTISKLCSNMQIMGPQFKNEQTNLVCCEKCGLVFVDIDSSQENFNQYYKSDYSHSPSYKELYSEEIENQYFEQWHNEIKNLINFDSYIVDIGGGLGDFGKYLKDKGYKNIYVMDINEKAIQSIENKGVTGILSDTINIDESLKNKFDLVMFANSLEHYYEFDKAIESAKMMLKDNGYIYIELPDAEKYCDIDNAPFMLFTYEHLYHFTTNTMKNIANSQGLKVINIKQATKCDGFNVIRTIYNKLGNIIPTIYDDIAENAIKKYIKYSKNKLAAVKKFEQSQEKLILWGIGASTALLLNETFDNCNVIQLIDRNTSRQNLKYKIGNKDFAIEDPSTIKDKDAAIIVLPFWYRDSIKNNIKNLGLTNEIKTLIIGEK